MSTPSARKDTVARAMRKLARKRWEGVSKEERSEICRAAANKRWKK